MVEATSAPASPAPRFVPGAPPAAPLSKSQKKRRAKAGGKADTAPDSPVAIPNGPSTALDKTPESEDVKEGSVAPEIVVQPEPRPPTTPLPEDDAVLKSSPIVELVTKRLKATNKKILRISTYASTDPEKLNDDQKRTLKTLPALEAVQKELGEVKKVIEVYESELAHELAVKRQETEKAEQARIAETVASAERTYVAKASELLTLIRLRSSITTGESDPLSLGIQPYESNALFAMSETVLGQEGESKQAILDGFFSGAGDFDGVPYSRLYEIYQLFLSPPRIPTPEPAPEPETPDSSADAEPEANNDLPVSGVTVTIGAISTSSSFHFMQASELDGPTFEETAEWVEQSDVVEPKPEAPADDIETEAPPTPEVNGYLATNGDIPAPQGGESLDWAADDEDGLPSIAGLHAKFGTSGSATPDAGDQPQASPAPAEEAPAEEPVTNGHTPDAPSAQVNEDDGFTQARGGRGFRGRGNGFRGGERGHRGGDRGSFRGHRGDRGSFRGHRGGERGGGFRGGRGEWRGDGEHRGRGRGRGRGGPHPHPQTPTTPTPA